MSLSEQDIEDLIRQNLPEAQVRVRRLREDGDDFEAWVSAPSFRGLSRVDQHRAVHKAMAPAAGGWHSLILHTSVAETP